METKPTYEELEQRVRELEKEAEMRMRTDEELEESEKHYHQLVVETMEQAIGVTDQNYLLTHVNDRFCRLLEYSQDEMIGHHLSEFIHDDYKDILEDQMTRRRKGGEKSYEIAWRTKNGNTKHTIGSPKGFFDKKGNFTGSFGILTDISDLKKAEEALRVSEAKYKALYDNALVALFKSAIEDGKPIAANKIAADIFGYASIDEFIEEFRSEKHYVNIDDRKPIIQELKKKGYIDKVIIHSKKTDGTILWTEGSFRLDPEGKYVDCVAIDITKRKRAEEELVSLATVVEQASESVIVSNRPGIIQYVNPSFERLSGFTKEELVGKHFRTFKSDKHDESFYKEMWEVISHGNVWKGRITNRMKDGTLREFETIISPIRDSSNEIVNFVSVNRDITKEVELEAQLRQAHKMEAIGTLAGGIAHEFNNILGIIIGNTELAIDDVPEWNPAKNCLEEIRSASLRAKDVVRHILSFARKSYIDRKPVPISPIIRDTFKLLRASLPSSVDIRQDFSSEHDTVLSDPTQINQVLVNLCTNSAHSMRDEGGVLDVKLENVVLDEETATQYEDLSPGNHVKLTVKDTGHGIKPENLDRIFDPYFTTKGVGEGTGMGLSVVHGIVKSHDGAVTVNSEPDKGTVVEVLLPITEAEVEPKVVEPKDLPTGDEKILFVDDEESLVEMVPQMLERLGYQVEAKTNPDEALELFRSKPDEFDLVISDMTMPQMTGDKLAKKLMEIRPDIPIIISTGFSMKMDEDKAKKMDIRAVVMKPFVMRTLAVTVRKVLDEK